MQNTLEVSFITFLIIFHPIQLALSKLVISLPNCLLLFKKVILQNYRYSHRQNQYCMLSDICREIMFLILIRILSLSSMNFSESGVTLFSFGWRHGKSTDFHLSYNTSFPVQMCLFKLWAFYCLSTLLCLSKIFIWNRLHSTSFFLQYAL